MNTAPVRKQSLTGHTVNAVLIYDDFHAAAQTKCLLERAGRRAGKAVQCVVSPWRLDLLQHPDAGDAILAESTRADLLLLVLQSVQTIPAWLMNWLGGWAERRQVPHAALALRSGGAPLPVLNQALRRFASRHGLSWLQTQQHPNTRETTDFIRDLQERGAAVTSTLQAILNQPLPLHGPA